MKLVIIFVSLVALGYGQSVDYCSSVLCNGNRNIACNNTGAFGQACPAGARMVSMTPALRAAILNSHNTKRNTIASGSLTGFRPATRMATMRWNNELALIASYNAKRCIYGHDACRNAPGFRLSGQNIGKMWWSRGNGTDRFAILKLINTWWSEYKQTTMADINSFPANNRAKIGHFTVMTSYKNNAVGCAAIQYRDRARNNWQSLTIVCNYARINIAGSPMYIAGPAASSCTTGTNPNYPALCSIQEQYNVNVP